MSKRQGKTEFERWLRPLMESKGIYSDADLSRATGVDGSMISKWWQGTQPQISSLRKLAPTFEVRLGDLIVKAGLATAQELGMIGAPPPAPPPGPRDPLIRKITNDLHDESIPEALRSNLRRAVQHAYDVWLEWMKTLDQDPGTSRREQSGR